MSKNHKTVYRLLNYIEYLPILINQFNYLISAFAFLVGIPVEIMSFSIGFFNLYNGCRNWKL